MYATHKMLFFHLPFNSIYQILNNEKITLTKDMLRVLKPFGSHIILPSTHSAEQCPPFSPFHIAKYKYVYKITVLSLYCDLYHFAVVGPYIWMPLSLIEYYPYLIDWLYTAIEEGIKNY